MTEAIASQVPPIKVLIGKSLSQVSISGMDLKKELFFKDSKKSYAGNTKLRVDCSRVKNQTSRLLASLSSQTGLINWNKDRYRGKFKIISSLDSKNGGCNLVNEIPLEDYISSLLAKEMRSDWPIEALKAQAVAARTYAYQKIISNQVSKDAGENLFYDVENSEKHQVTGNFFDETESTYRASSSTKGEILTLKNGEITPIFFHSKCGGKTLKPEDVWSHPVEGYVSVDCPFCHKYGKKPWTHKLKISKFTEYLDEALKRYNNDKILSPGKVVKLVANTVTSSKLYFYDEGELKNVQKSRIRGVLGSNQVASNNYSVEKIGDEIILQGKGHGHGVGMCQFGAFELAKRGYSYKDILNFYFPNHQLKRLY